ncbi:MAG: RNA polymerase sigma factor [Candidatus Yanofskybacteria bacterium]|nr:RNA polymerase sigma factor [Candidatus Yanofskybacteria bacterium]
MDDRALVEQCQKGELEKFSVLYDRHVAALYVFIYSKTHHKETAEDLTSQSFLKALGHINTFDASRGAFRSWIYQIARNTVIDYYRTHRSESDVADAWDIPADGDMARDIDVKTQLTKVQQYLQGLNQEQRDIVVLRLWHDLSYREIADIMGKSEASCKMSFSRTVRKLKKDIVLVLLTAFLSL